MNPELLGNLRDIHEPLPPPFWPPAPGWWILAFLVMALIAVAIWLAWRRYRAIERARVPYRIAEQDLAAAFDEYAKGLLDARAFADDANAILKRLIAQHEHRAAATSYGRDWIQEIVERFERPDLFPLFDATLGAARFAPGFEPEVRETYERLTELIRANQAVARP